jgi:hypothetical protein
MRLGTAAPERHANRPGEYHHVEALEEAGGTAITKSYWLPDAMFDDGGVGLFSTLEIVETVEISLYLLGVSAYVRAGEDFGARLCAERWGPRRSTARSCASPKAS